MARKSRKRSSLLFFNIAPFLVPGLALVVFLSFSFAYLSDIGLRYDECIFVNAALGGVVKDYIYKSVFNIPIMVFPYEGALKAWIYYPLFKIFNVSTASIRVPAIIISALALIIWYQNSKLIFTEKLYPLLFILLLATDPTFINHGKMDYGPFVLQSFFVAAAYYCYLQFIIKKSPFYFSLLLLVMLLGMWNKLNFVWLVTALSVSGILFHRREILAAYKKNRFIITLMSLLFILVMGLIIYFLVIPLKNFPMGGDILQITYFEKIRYIVRTYFLTMAGSLPYEIIYADSVGSVVNYIELGIMALSLSFILLIKKNAQVQAYESKILFFYTVAFLLLAQIILTPQARNSYHILIMWPLQHLIFLLSMGMCAYVLNQRIARAGTLIFTALIIISQLIVNFQYLYAFDHKQPDAQFSPAINALSAYINQYSQKYDEIMSIQFGINNQLLALASDNTIRKKIHEYSMYILTNNIPYINKARNIMYPQFARTDLANEQWLYNNYFKGKNVLILSYADFTFQQQAENFFSFAAKYHLKLNKLPYITDKTDTPIYSLYTSLQKPTL